MLELPAVMVVLKLIFNHYIQYVLIVLLKLYLLYTHIELVYHTIYLYYIYTYLHRYRYDMSIYDTVITLITHLFITGKPSRPAVPSQKMAGSLHESCELSQSQRFSGGATWAGQAPWYLDDHPVSLLETDPAGQSRVSLACGGAGHQRPAGSV